jgi:uncharacterized protein (TIGR02996 family)
MATFVPDSNRTLRALLTACHAAEDARAPLAALADWLDERDDPRGPLVRMGRRYWEIQHIDKMSNESLGDLYELEDTMPRQGDPVIKRWLGFSRRALVLTVEWTRPLPFVHVDAYRLLDPAQRKRLLQLMKSGWVWEIRFPFLDEGFRKLLTKSGTIWQLRLDENEAVRDEDLKLLAQVPHLRELDLRETGISDAGLRHLHKIKTLRAIFVERANRITKGGAAALQKALPGCTLHYH